MVLSIRVVWLWLEGERMKNKGAGWASCFKWF